MVHILLLFIELVTYLSNLVIEFIIVKITLTNFMPILYARIIDPSLTTAIKSVADLTTNSDLLIILGTLIRSSLVRYPGIKQ